MDPDKTRTLASYAKHFEYHSRKFSDRMDFDRRYEFGLFLRELRGKRVLELGCGAGDHTKYFADKGLDITGIDLSPEMLALAYEKGVDACLMDIENIDFPHGSFDGIWAVTSLLHIPKARMPPVVDRLADISKQQALLYVCVKEGIGEGMVVDAHDRTTERYFAYYEKPELHNLFASRFHAIDSRVEYLGNQPFVQTFFRKSGL